jgi:hypothetical protein
VCCLRAQLRKEGRRANLLDLSPETFRGALLAGSSRKQCLQFFLLASSCMHPHLSVLTSASCEKSKV